MRLVVLCAAFIGLPCALGGVLRVQNSAQGGLPSFDTFVQLHKRSYAAGSAEYEERRSLYEARAAKAAKHNSQTDKRWTAAVNKLWDWNDAELKKLRGWVGGSRPQKSTLALAHHHGVLKNGTSKAVNATNATAPKKALPASKSWDGLGTISGKIHNQGGCGSCWAVAAAQTLSAHHEIHRGKLRRFSIQQILACTPNPQQCGGEGYCKGATVELAMDWVMENGCATEQQAPYLSVNGDTPTCVVGGKAAPTNRLLWAAGAKQAGAADFGLTGWERLPENKYEPLMRALAETGPVAVSVSASPWVDYGTGIFDGCDKNAIIDHAVVLIGYGEEGTNKYWKIQNSWGDDWGEHGNVRLLRHADEEAFCGIDDKPELGTGCIGGPKQVTVCGTCGILYDSVVPHFAQSF